ncbi:putative head-tail adaptor [Escherichia coli O157:H- str. H 2687]|nr:putative head-tail adaptor [Escherichia coli O157:H- str. H 2687]
MRDFQNAFDAALAGVDSTIVEVMGLCAQFTSGAQCGGEVQGVFDDPESLGFAGSGVRIEGAARHYLYGRIRFVLCGVVTR